MMMMMDDEPTASRVNYLGFFRRVAANHWRLMLLIFVAVSVAAGVGSLVFLPKTYDATATIFIETPMMEQSALLRDWLAPSNASLQIAILRTRSLAEEVVEKLSREATEELGGQSMQRDYVLDVQNAIRWVLGQEPLVSSPHQVVDELREARVQFTPLASAFNPRPSGEVQIRATAYQPRVAMELANAYVGVLQDRNRAFTREETRATREFIENFLNQAKTGLQESERALTKFERATGVIPLPQRSGFELTKLAQLESSLADIQVNKEIAKARLNFLNGGKDLSGRSRPAAATVTLQRLRDRLVRLEDTLNTLLDKYTEHHPQVMATRAEIKEVQERLNATLQSLQNPQPATPIRLSTAERATLAKQMADLEVEISSLEAKEDVLKQRIASLARNVSTLSAEEKEGTKLLQKVETQRNLSSLLSDKLTTARIQEQAGDRSLRVIDRATLPLSHSRAPANKIILLGLVLGLSLGVGVAALLETFNQPIETSDDVMHLTGLPVLGWLPRVETGRLGNNRTREPLSLVENFTPRALPAEGCRSIRTSLTSLSRHRPLRSIMLASAGPREGKSTILLNLAWAFWELGQRLILVDSDLRRPCLHRALRSSSQPGLVDLLMATVPWNEVQQPIKANFVFLPAGAVKRAHPGSLLSPENIRRVLDLAKDHSDLILFDSPPILAVSDNRILASMVDGVILVVRAGVTQRRDLLEAKDQLENGGAHLLGVVLNEVSPRETRRYYTRYATYYDPSEVLPPSKSPWWNPRSWARGGQASKNDRQER